MHDQPLNQPNLSQDAMQELDQRVVRVLETAPRVVISADFASRVASQLPAKRPVSLTATHYGRSATLIGILITLAALLALTLHPLGTARFGLLESVLFAQFVGLVVWLSVMRHSLR